jgi:hypothetical protein
MERERIMSGRELSRAVGAFRGRRRKMRVPILERSAFRHGHHAVVAAASAAARGQTRLRTGRNERQHRPEPVQENETNAHDATHGVPSYPEIHSKGNLDSAYSQFLSDFAGFPCGTSTLNLHNIANALTDADCYRKVGCAPVSRNPRGPRTRLVAAPLTRTCPGLES